MKEGPMSERTAKDAALDYFAQKYNCAEATLLGLLESCGIDCGCAPRIATGFGAGFGFCGDICGALSGAVMAIGLKFGRENASDNEQKIACYHKVQQVVELFELEFGTVKCVDLTECEMRTPEGQARAKELDLHNKVCPRFVAFAAEIASKLID